MLVHRLRRWPNIDPTMDECLVLDGECQKKTLRLGNAGPTQDQRFIGPTRSQRWASFREECPAWRWTRERNTGAFHEECLLACLIKPFQQHVHSRTEWRAFISRSGSINIPSSPTTKTGCLLCEGCQGRRGGRCAAEQYTSFSAVFYNFA